MITKKLARFGRLRLDANALAYFYRVAAMISKKFVNCGSTFGRITDY